MPFHAMVVFTLGYDFLFKSTVGHCDMLEKESEWPTVTISVLVKKYLAICQNDSC